MTSERSSSLLPLKDADECFAGDVEQFLRVTYELVLMLVAFLGLQEQPVGNELQLFAEHEAVYFTAGALSVCSMMFDFLL